LQGQNLQNASERCFRLSHLQTSQSTETVMLSKLVMWPV